MHDESSGREGHVLALIKARAASNLAKPWSRSHHGLRPVGVFVGDAEDGSQYTDMNNALYRGEKGIQHVNSKNALHHVAHDKGTA